MLPHHRKILVALDENTQPFGEMCVPFKVLAREAGMEDVREVRRITRHLARKGYAEFWIGLVTEDFEFAGAGYCITKTGREFLDAEQSR